MDTSQTIELCKALFYVFAGIAAASFLLSVYLFFKFDIPYTYSMLTGKAKKRTIEQMEKQKFQTGKLRMNYGNTGGTKSHTGKHGRTETAKTAGITAQPGYSPPPTPAPVAPPAAPEYRAETQVLQMDAPETQILQPDLPDTEILRPDIPEPQVQNQEDGITMILNTPQQDPCTEDLSKTTMLKPEAEPDFLFRITEETISINTNELI